MPGKNPRPERPNKGCLYLAKPGGGKSQAMKQNPYLPKSGVRTLLIDPAHDQNLPGTVYISDRAEYARHVAKAVARGAGFRLAYDGPRSPEIAEWWFQVAWAIADGRRDTYLLIEELARICPNPGEAPYWHNLTLEEGRKYGLIYHATSQRPQSITKTAYHNVNNYLIGVQHQSNAKTMAELADVDVNDIKSLQEMQFFTNHPWPRHQSRKLQLKYQK